MSSCAQNKVNQPEVGSSSLVDEFQIRSLLFTHQMCKVYLILQRMLTFISGPALFSKLPKCPCGQGILTILSTRFISSIYF